MKVLISALVATVLIMAAATSVFAQAAVQEPGLAAFNRPNVDVLNAGRGGYRAFDSANAYYNGPVLAPQPRTGSTPRHHRGARQAVQ